MLNLNNKKRLPALAVRNRGSQGKGHFPVILRLQLLVLYAQVDFYFGFGNAAEKHIRRIGILK